MTKGRLWFCKGPLGAHVVLDATQEGPQPSPGARECPSGPLIITTVLQCPKQFQTQTRSKTTGPGTSRGIKSRESALLGGSGWVLLGEIRSSSGHLGFFLLLPQGPQEPSELLTVHN